MVQGPTRVRGRTPVRGRACGRSWKQVRCRLPGCCFPDRARRRTAGRAEGCERCRRRADRPDSAPGAGVRRRIPCRRRRHRHRGTRPARQRSSRKAPACTLGPEYRDRVPHAPEAGPVRTDQPLVRGDVPLGSTNCHPFGEWSTAASVPGVDVPYQDDRIRVEAPGTRRESLRVPAERAGVRPCGRRGCAGVVPARITPDANGGPPAGCPAAGPRPRPAGPGPAARAPPSR